MRLLGPPPIALLALAALAGCAADSPRNRETTRSLGRGKSFQYAQTTTATDSRSVLSTSAAATPAVRPASYYDEALPPATKTTEVLAAPAAPLGQEDRPSLPLDLATALGLTQQQNPRVAFAQAQVSQAYA